jgi:hypothetical protein
MSFPSQSQAGQDRFIWELFEHVDGGTFFDVGSGHAWEYSNTFALEVYHGWGGYLFDRHHYQQDPTCRDYNRSSAMIVGDAAQNLLGDTRFLSIKWIDYLSLDVDGDSGKVLAVLLEMGISYGAITIEHDWYSRGRDLRDLERRLLRSAGYDLVCSDISWGQGPFEDWWVHAGKFSLAQRDKFRCNNRWWRDVPHIMDDL